MTLYDVLNIPETTPTALVEPASLVEDAGAPPPARRAALAVLHDPEARADYDARHGHGLPLRLALAWGLAALAAGDVETARAHWLRAERIAPENRAVAALLGAVADDVTEARAEAPEELRAAARAEVERLRNNSAFPHRLLRYAGALAGASEEEGDAEVLIGAARELLQYDVAEAPRAYSLTLPVLKEHYPAAYAMDAPFFDAILSVLAERAPRADDGKPAKPPTAKPASEAGDDYSLADLIGPTGPSGPSGRSRAPSEDPPRRAPSRPRMELPTLPRLPAPGPAWIGAAFGALFGLRLGVFGMVRGAIFGFIITYILLIIVERSR